MSGADEVLEGGLRYTEEICPDEGRGPYRRCSLRVPGVQEAVSSLKLLSFRIRFGAVAIEAEGYGTVQTLPEHRGRGYAQLLLERSAASASRRVDALFLYGIQKLYPKVGFVSCLPATSLSLRVRYAEAARCTPYDVQRILPGDLRAAAELYDTEHGIRPWTLVQGDDFERRLARTAVWRPSLETYVARQEGRLKGYIVLAAIGYGHAPRAFSVSELTAADEGAARALIGEAARIAWERRIDTFSMAEPPDGTAGRAARRLGCDVNEAFVPDGGGMGRILNRSSLLSRLAPELSRRAACVELGEVIRSSSGCRLEGFSVDAFQALVAGELVPDDRDLLRLLLGYWSWQDAEGAGVTLPEAHRRTLRRWFPGASPQLPAPHSHELDRY